MKTIETSKGKFGVVEINSIAEGQYYVDTLSSYHYKLSEITEEQSSEIADSVTRNSYGEEIGWKNYPFEGHPFNYPILNTALESLNTLLKHHNIEITPNTYIFKV